jgi:hypothetical protein
LIRIPLFVTGDFPEELPAAQSRGIIAAPKAILLFPSLPEKDS